MNFACIDVKNVDVVIGIEKISYVTFVLNVAKKHSSTASTANTKQNTKTTSYVICAVGIKLTASVECSSAAKLKYNFLHSLLCCQQLVF
jgi:hypothetical protein